MKMNINVTGLDAVKNALGQASSQVPFALAVAMNATVEQARKEVRSEMGKVFDRPTPWVLNSLRIKKATKSKPEAELAFKDKDSVTSSRTMVFPHVEGGQRAFKAMEARLMSAGLMPAGYNAVPGAAAKLDANGNMNRGQITQLLNVLQTYREAGYNKADARTVARLAKGNVKKNIYGFTYWVNPVGGQKGKHLQPGVYQRVQTGFGSSLKPVLIFVRRAQYKSRLDFYGITQRVIAQHLEPEFIKAFEQAMRTAIYKSQGVLL
jgi:hypothetical protein